MALMLGLAASAMSMDMQLIASSKQSRVERPKTQLTPKQKKARAKNNAGKKARKIHRKI